MKHLLLDLFHYDYFSFHLHLFLLLYYYPTSFDVYVFFHVTFTSLRVILNCRSFASSSDAIYSRRSESESEIIAVALHILHP